MQNFILEKSSDCLKLSKRVEKKYLHIVLAASIQVVQYECYRHYVYCGENSVSIFSGLVLVSVVQNISKIRGKFPIMILESESPPS